MMAALIGNVREFNPNSERLQSYLDRLSSYFATNRIGVVPENATPDQNGAADREKVHALISMIGIEGYGVIANASKPDSPASKSLDALIKMLKTHYIQTKVEIAETFKFHQVMQRKDETIANFLGRLRSTASACNYGDFLNRALRDQFVVGLYDDDDRKQLLSRTRELEECMKLATAGEAARSQMVKMNCVKKGNMSDQTDLNAVSFYKDGARAKTQDNSKQYGQSKPQYGQSSKPYKCFSCGKTSHKRTECRFRDSTCHNCSQKGHIATVCRQPKSKSTSRVHNVEDSEGSDEPLYTVSVFDMHSKNTSSVQVSLQVEKSTVDMQIDTGCAMSLAPKSFYDSHCSHVPLQSTDIVMNTYSGEKLYPLGCIDVQVKYLNNVHKLPLIILPSGSVPLFGRNWMRSIKLDWKALGLNYIKPSRNSQVAPQVKDKSVSEVIKRFGPLFAEELGCYKGEPIDLPVQTKPRFFKARLPGFSEEAQITDALLEMEASGVLKRVYYASCACPIVPVQKKDSENATDKVKIRITGNFAATYNKCAEVYKYPIPKIEDLHAALRGCTVFSVLDMSQAYHQIPISDESQKYMTINTHLGLFSFTRLPNGVHSGPAVFQQIMDTVLSGAPKTICYLDDILVAGANAEDHLRNLALVFQRLYEAGFRLRKEKCRFECSKVTYLGHVLDAEGLHPTEDKVRAVQEAPSPKDETQLKSFLGLLMFYSRFIPFHSKLLAPLNRLLRNNVQWTWGKIEENAFCGAKKALLNSQTLVHYDSDLPLYLSCDASSYGAGAVLSHKIGGHDRPVAFASVTLTQAQRNYSQLDKEAFSIIFGLKRFRQFLAAREFTIITDHKPLLQILGPTNLIPVHTAARLQRWALILASFKYKLEYRSTKLHGNADFVSRLPLPGAFLARESTNVDCHFFEEQVMTNVTSALIAKSTSKDIVLSKVLRYVMNGWPSTVDDPLLVPYFSRKLELTIEQGCVLWGYRVLIPKELQKAVLQELHDTHPGITRMKRLARSYVWWPNLDEQVEKLVNQCDICQTMRSDPPRAQVHPWIYPSRPWCRLHIDFKGPIGGRTYLVLVDAYSKYPEVVKMNSTTSTATLAVLRDIFSRQGLPEVLVSDNGPQFVSREFENFCSKNGIVHHTSAVHKPASNGQAERVVQILSSALKQAQLIRDDVDSVIARYLLIYRNTPHSTTGEAPSMLLMGRRLRTRLDLMLPSINKKVEQTQQATISRNATRGVRILHVGDRVQARNYGLGEKWTKGVITELLGSKHYLVDIGGEIWKRHIDQLIKCDVENTGTNMVKKPIVTYEAENEESQVLPEVNVPIAEQPSNEESVSESVEINPPLESETSGDTSGPPVIASDVSSPAKVYPTRGNRMTLPSRFNDYEMGTK